MSNYDILYPKNERQGFDGGKNNKFEKHLIADNESPDALNVIFTNRSVETRLGTSKFNTASVGSFAGHGFYTKHDRSGSEKLTAWWNGTLYVASGTTFATVPSAQSIFTAGVRVGAAEQENYIFYGNGNNPGYKFDGTDFTRHGIPAPTQTATASSFATGSVTGDYVYRYTNVNTALVESDGGPVSVTFTAASATVRIAAIATAPASHGVASRRVYRTKNNSFATYFRVATLSDNTTTFVTDNLLDNQLGAELPRDAGEPPQYSFIINHQGRLFCNDTANPSFVWYSKSTSLYDRT